MPSSSSVSFRVVSIPSYSAYYPVVLVDEHTRLQLAAPENENHDDDDHHQQQGPQTTTTTQPTTTATTVQGQWGGWGWIGGYKNQIKQLQEAVSFPLNNQYEMNILATLLTNKRTPTKSLATALTTPRGVLVHGAGGTGKTAICKACCIETPHAFTFFMCGPEFMAITTLNEKITILQQAFDELRSNQPSIMFLDQIDIMFPNNTNNKTQQHPYGADQKQLLFTFLSLVDSLSSSNGGGSSSSSSGGIVFLGTAMSVSSVHPLLLQSGRFERHIGLHLPRQEERQHILAIHTNRFNLSKDVCLSSLSSQVHGRTAGDIAVVCQNAALHSAAKIHNQLLRTTLPPHHNENNDNHHHDDCGNHDHCKNVTAAGTSSSSSSADHHTGGLLSPPPSSSYYYCSDECSLVDEEGIKAAEINTAHFEYALSLLPPLPPPPAASSSPSLAPSPLIHHHHHQQMENEYTIQDLHDIQQELKELILYPIQYPHLLRKFGVSSSFVSGVLLYGPGGCGKTLLAKNIAAQCHASLFVLACSSTTISPHIITETFATAMNPLVTPQPALILIHELHALGLGLTQQQDCINTLQQEMANVHNIHYHVVGSNNKSSQGQGGGAGGGDVCVVATSTRPERIPFEFFELGLVSHTLYVPPPDSTRREAILRAEFQHVPVSSDVDFGLLAHDITPGWSCADITRFCSRVKRTAITDCILRSEKEDHCKVSKEHFENSYPKGRACGATDPPYYEQFAQQMKYWGCRHSGRL